jgi:hypothetical protein
MTRRTKNLGKTLRRGDYALELVTGFPVVIRDFFEGGYRRYCEFYGCNPGLGGAYSKNLKPITESEFRVLREKRLLASGFYFQPCIHRHWAVYDKTGNMVCMTAYKKGAVHTVYRLNLLAEMGHSVIRYIKHGIGSDSFAAKRMTQVILHTLEQTEGINSMNKTEDNHEER